VLAKDTVYINENGNNSNPADGKYDKGPAWQITNNGQGYLAAGNIRWDNENAYITGTLKSGIIDDVTKKPIWQINNDGSGHLANNNITWNEKGEMKIQAATIIGRLTATQIDASELEIQSGNIKGLLTATQIDVSELSVSHLDTKPNQLSSSKGRISIYDNTIDVYSNTIDDAVILRITGDTNHENIEIPNVDGTFKLPTTTFSASLIYGGGLYKNIKLGTITIPDNGYNYRYRGIHCPIQTIKLTKNQKYSLNNLKFGYNLYLCPKGETCPDYIASGSMASQPIENADIQAFLGNQTAIEKHWGSRTNVVTWNRGTSNISGGMMYLGASESIQFKLVSEPWTPGDYDIYFRVCICSDSRFAIDYQTTEEMLPPVTAYTTYKDDYKCEITLGSDIEYSLLPLNTSESFACFSSSGFEIKRGYNQFTIDTDGYFSFKNLSSGMGIDENGVWIILNSRKKYFDIASIQDSTGQEITVLKVQ
jgi:hypothetical protein